MRLLQRKVEQEEPVEVRALAAAGCVHYGLGRRAGSPVPRLGIRVTGTDAALFSHSGASAGARVGASA